MILDLGLSVDPGRFDEETADARMRAVGQMLVIQIILVIGIILVIRHNIKPLNMIRSMLGSSSERLEEGGE